jgi:hypothetical protein
MTTTMREVPVLDSLLSGAAESNYTGTRASSVPCGTGIHALARVAPVADQVTGTTNAAGTLVHG